MRYIRYSFLLLLPLAWWSLTAQENGPVVEKNPPPTATQLMTESAQNLMQLPGLDAEFRYRMNIYHETLQGTGHYYQSGSGPEKKFRLELLTKLEDRTVVLQTLCDQDYLWIRRDFGMENQSLARINMRRFKKALKDAGPPLSVDPTPTWLGVVTLPKLMSVLNGWFNFGVVEETQLGARDVYVLRGRINPELRQKHLAPGLKNYEGAEQLPDAVRVTLGRDAVLPLFPYRLEFLQLNETEQTTLPHLVIDFHAVKVKPELDAALFKYESGDQEVEDQTIPFLQKLGFNISE